MLIVRSVGPEAVAYYLNGRHPGRWNDGAGALLGLRGGVGRSDLAAVLRGRDPASGTFLPDHRPARRRAGWDLVFAAPKSVSLLGATAGGDGGETVWAAHDVAVDAVLSWVQGRLTVAHGPRDRADGMVAATFTHTTNGAGEPHLHSHVLVANLTRSGGRWWAARSEDWFVNRSALGSLYALELRHRLREAGWDLQWRLRPDGLADLADVPRAAVRAASTQAAAPGAGARFAARRSPPVPWRERAARAGLGQPEYRLAAPRASTPDPGRSGGIDDPAVERAVTARLAAARSAFRATDVVTALAAAHAGGAPTAAVDRFVARVCAASEPVRSPTRDGRWSPPAAVGLDDRLRRELAELAARPVAGCPPPADRPPASGSPAKSGGADRADAAAVRLLGSTGALIHLGGPPGRGDWLATADVLDACRAGWEAAGLVARVHADRAALPRWALLTGIPGHQASRGVDVLVVDGADRRTTSELLDLVGWARTTGGRLVLVHGGTRPRLSEPLSRGLADGAAAAGPIDPGPHRPWSVADDGRDGPGRAAAGRLLRAWAGASGDRPVMVGLGLDEVIGLNRAAGAGPERRGAAGPGGAAGLRDGDRVVLLGRRAGPVPAGWLGTVEGIGTRRRVRWDGDRGRSEIDDHLRRRLRPGWAVTPAVATRTAGPLMVLGPAAAAGPALGRVVASVEREGPAPARALQR